MQDILPELDRKIVKQLTPKEAEAVNPLEKKLILRSPAPAGTEGAGQDYFIHACRRENVRLVFASAEEGGVLGKLRLCPLLIDLFVVLPGTPTLTPAPDRAAASRNVCGGCACGHATRSHYSV